MVYKYWTISSIDSALNKLDEFKNLNKKNNNSDSYSFPSDSYSFSGTFKGVIKTVTNGWNDAVILTAYDFERTPKEPFVKINIYINLDKAEKQKIILPFIKNETIKFDFSDKDVFRNKKNELSVRTKIKDLTLNCCDGTSLVYVERFKCFVHLNNKKASQNTPFYKSLLKGLKLYLIVPENKTSAGEFDFLSCLHPHIWDKVEKRYVNFGSSEAIATAIKNIPKYFNCACVLRGGEGGLEVFDKESIREAIKERKEKYLPFKPLYLVAGVGHNKNDIKGLQSFDYNAATPTAAATFLNSQFPISTNRDQVFRQKK